MHIELKVAVPEFEWVNAPTLYETPLGEFKSMFEVNQVEHLINFLRGFKDIQHVIDLNDMLRRLICLSLVTEYLPCVPENEVAHRTSCLNSFLIKFQTCNGTGIKLIDYKFAYKILCDGRKFKFKNSDLLFNNEVEAIHHLVKNYISDSDYNYKLVK